MRTNFFRKVALACTVVLALMCLLAPTALADGGLSVAPVSATLTPEDMVNALLGGGVTVSNVVYTGADAASGTFSGGTGIVGFESGILLTSGDIVNVIGPNTNDGITKDNSLPGAADLNALIPGYSTYDATILEFDFVPTGSVLTFQYIFASDEYNEYVNTSYNDVFGFFVNGANVALIPGTSTPVSINNVNGGGPTYGVNPSNSTYYRNNDLQNGGGSINTEMDGLTVVLPVVAVVNPGVTNHIKLAIADAGDRVLDSAVFIEAGSFQSYNLSLVPQNATNPVGTDHTMVATLLDSAGAPVADTEITFTVTGANPQVYQATTNEDGQATFTYTGINAGLDTIVATGGGETSNEAFKTWEGEPVAVPGMGLWSGLAALTATGILGIMVIRRKALSLS